MKGDIILGICLFIIGILLFLGFGSVVTYWIIKESPEDWFYESFGLVSGMSALTVVFNIWGNYIFSPEPRNWILFFASVTVVLFIVFYIFGYIKIGYNKFEIRLLLLSFPTLLEIYFIIIFISYKQINQNILIMLFSILLSIFTLLSSIISSKQLKETRNKLRFYQKNSNSDVFELESFYISNSRNNRARIEQVILKLYTLLQEEHLPMSKIHDYVKMSEIPREISQKMVERLFEKSLYKNMPAISLIEFAQEILPEYFRTEKYSKTSYRNSSMDIRMYEDLYDRFKRLMYSERNEITELNAKVDHLCENFIIKAQIETNKQRVEVVDETSCQNQIRELFHALETPIAVTEMAISNLNSSFDNLTEEQLKKIYKIENNIKIMKCILYAYRELTFMTIRNHENAFLPLPTIVYSMKGFLFEHYNEVEIEYDGFPDTIPDYSTNLITILILPLLQNAMEATPKEKKINISYFHIDDYNVIKIQNYCIQPPSQSNLNKEGYSSKGNNHVGSGISIVKRISSTAGILFSISVKNKQVIAILNLPDKK